MIDQERLKSSVSPALFLRGRGEVVFGLSGCNTGGSVMKSTGYEILAGSVRIRTESRATRGPLGRDGRGGYLLVAGLQRVAREAGAATRREQAFANTPVLGSDIWTLHRLLQSQGLAVVLPGKLAASLLTLDPSSREIAVRGSTQNSRRTWQAGLRRELLGSGSLARGGGSDTQ
jgi:hypothetical protein